MFNLLWGIRDVFIIAMTFCRMGKFLEKGYCDSVILKFGNENDQYLNNKFLHNLKEFVDL